MKNFNKTFQKAANLLKEVEEIDSPLINIFCHDDKLSVTFWRPNMIDYFEIVVYSNDGEIVIDKNCDYIFEDWPNRRINEDDFDLIKRLVDEFYKY